MTWPFDESSTSPASTASTGPQQSWLLAGFTFGVGAALGEAAIRAAPGAGKTLGNLAGIAVQQLADASAQVLTSTWGLATPTYPHATPRPADEDARAKRRRELSPAEGLAVTPDSADGLLELRRLLEPSRPGLVLEQRHQSTSDTPPVATPQKTESEARPSASTASTNVEPSSSGSATMPPALDESWARTE